MIKDKYDKDLFTTIWKKHNLDNKFEFINFQFAIHYFLESNKILDNILKTISNNLTDGGLVCFTFMDVNQIEKLLNKQDVIQNEIFTLTKVDSIPLKNSIGQKVKIKIHSINIESEEYLVDFDNFLNQQCNKYKLYKSRINYLNEDSEKKGYFKDINLNYNLTEVEEQFSHLYRYAIFEKNSKAIKNIDKFLSSSD